MLTKKKKYDCTLAMSLFKIIESLPFTYFKMLEVPLSPCSGLLTLTKFLLILQGVL